MRYRILAAGILSLGPLIGSATAMEPPSEHSEHGGHPEPLRSGNRRAALL